MPQISVIVPVYKVEAYLARCVDSILDQSFGGFDLILVDDGSPDKCPQICDAYGQRDDRIVVIHKQNGGLSDARNAGIDWAMEHSDSQWLAFVDSDDYLHPDYLKMLLEKANQESADLVICDFLRVDDQEQVIEKDRPIPDLVTEDKGRLFAFLLENWRIRPAWNKLYHKQIFSQLRFAFGKVHEDEFAIHHVLWNCRKVALIHDRLYYYRIRQNSIMMTPSVREQLDRIEALIDQYEFCQHHSLKLYNEVVSISFMNRVLGMKDKLAREDAERYQKLKKRYAAVFFSAPRNRSFKRRCHFYAHDLYEKLSIFYQNASKEK